MLDSRLDYFFYFYAFMVVDYSKWDSLDISDSEYDSESAGSSESDDSHSLCSADGYPQMKNIPIQPKETKKQLKFISKKLHSAHYKGSPAQRIHYMYSERNIGRHGKCTVNILIEIRG
jgi:hypothetical protein